MIGHFSPDQSLEKTCIDIGHFPLFSMLWLLYRFTAQILPRRGILPLLATREIVGMW